MIPPRLYAEAFGTFCLVFAGTGAVVVDGVTGAWSAGPISGASMNPARSCCGSGTIGRCA